jgi:hypothetical protein
VHWAAMTNPLKPITYNPKLKQAKLLEVEEEKENRKKN